GRDTYGLANGDESTVTVVRRDDFAVEPLGLLGVPLDEPRAVEDLPTRLGEWLALLGGENRREIVGVLDDEVVPATQYAGPVDGRRRGPSRPCSARCFDSPTHVDL